MLVTLDEAINKLKQGEVVGIPTETVYGLAAMISNPKAIELIFKTKERPFFDPLIVHIHSIDQAKSLTTWWPEQAQALAEAYWPGPLTLVLPKSEKVSSMITSGLESVGLRMPNHPMALELLQKIADPLAAPSANKFGRTSPTTALHVSSEFVNTQVAILDGGPCQIGLESTVLLLKKHDPVQISILRAGHVKRTDIEKTLSDRNLKFEFVKSLDKKESPGHMKHHYMPSVPLVIVAENPKNESEFIKTVLSGLAHAPDQIEGVQLVKPKQIKKLLKLQLSKDPTVAAREFYQKLRESAESGADLIYIIRQKDMIGENWEALNDRLTKAASLVLDGE